MNSVSTPKISVIINFYNMRREAQRTLYSLSAEYQQGVVPDDYEVIVMDNGSSEPLKEDWVKGFGNNFTYIFFNASSPSPCSALNYGVTRAKADSIICCIDRARILSPGILKYSLAAFKLYTHPFIYTLGMHIGPYLQNYLVTAGYNQELEDKLLSTIHWRKNGYELFKESSIAMSSKNGFYSKITESNCFAMKKDDFLAMDGFDERFTSAGGGIVNHDFFNKVHANPKFKPIMLLGEATFHQFHHGVATNVPMEEHPAEKMFQEYEAIKGEPFKHLFRWPEYFGWLSTEYHAKLMTIKEEK